MKVKNVHYPLVIVGAGAAGLGASEYATALNIDHVVLEASHRIGGRGLTEYLEGHIPVDLGCHWLHSASKNPYRQLADQYGFNYKTDKYEYTIHYEGEWLGQADIDESEAFVDNSYAEMERLYQQSPGHAAIDAIDSDSRWTPYFYYWMTLMHSNDADRVAVQDYVEFDDTGEDWPLREGYGALISKQGADCPVHLNTEVTAINWEKSPVDILTNKGTITTNKVIIAVSTGVLGADCIKFTPKLDDRKLDAINTLPMGNYNYQFFSIEPNALKDVPESIQYFDGEQALAIRIRSFDFPCIFTCTAGRYAWWLEKQGTEASRDNFTDALVKVLGSDVLKVLREFKVSAWGYDPWIRGAYSSQLPGRTGMRAILAEPIDDAIYFAGEATSTDALNTAHGAYLSGKRAVQEAFGSDSKQGIGISR